MRSFLKKLNILRDSQKILGRGGLRPVRSGEHEQIEPQMDIKVEENKENQDLKQEEVCIGDMLVEEEAKASELLSPCLDIEHIELIQQVDSTEQQSIVSNVSHSGVGDKQDLGEKNKIQTEGIAAIDADKDSVLVQEHLGEKEYREKLDQNVDFPTEGIGEKDYPVQEEFHLVDPMFSASEEKDPRGSVVSQVSQDTGNATAMMDDNTIVGSTTYIQDLQEFGFTDEKDMESKDELRVSDVTGVEETINLGPFVEGDESGTEEEQIAFMKDVENFCRQAGLEFKPPKFYGEALNLLKLWRAVIRLGGYEQVTACKLWRQVGESFNPPKTCTTVSWTFRIFYEKALLEYERHKLHSGELSIPGALLSQHVGLENQVDIHGVVSGRARRDSATRAMQGWHQHRLGNGEVTDASNKEKNLTTTPKREKQLKTIGAGTAKRKLPSPVEQGLRVVRAKTDTHNYETSIIDVGAPADWVKINVQQTSECFEIYALVPGLLREEVKVQSDPAGRVVISGEPEQLDYHWGITAFKKVVSLPCRINPHKTSAVITLHGQLFVRAPFEQPGV